MDSRLQGRIACITGAGSGIGRATALRFAASGARVVCTDLKPGDVPVDVEINEKFGDDRAIFMEVNVAHEDQIEAMVKKTVEWGGRLDIICNSAGVTGGARRRLHETPSDVFDQTLAVNTRGVWLCCKYALAQMLEQEPREPNARGERTRGWIINVASILGLVGTEWANTYVPSKHAVVGMTKQIALDYAVDRIHCNVLCPGYIDTPMTAHILSTDDGKARLAGMHPWNALGRPEDIADAALFLASDEAAWISGHALAVDGAYLAR